MEKFLLMIGELINFYQDTAIKKSLSQEEKRKLEDLTIKENEKMSLAEKIRQQRILEEKLKKKEKYIKELHKSRKVDLTKFLTRNKKKEQERIYNIEKERNELIEKERKELQEKPKISEISKKICLTEKTKQPIYLRTQSIINEKNKKIEELKKKRRNSLSQKKIEERRIKTQSYSLERFETFYDYQIKWRERIKNENEKRINYLEENNINLKECTFHPELSEGSLDILDTINYFEFMNGKKKNESIFNKLYNEMFEKKEKIERIKKKNLPSFKPYTNQNIKYKKIAAKFINKGTYSYNIKIEENKEKIEKKKLLEKKGKKRRIKSLDRRKKEDKIDIMKIGKIRKSESVDHWSTLLLKMKSFKKEKTIDLLYHLNIMRSTAWNENGVNAVPLKGESKNIIKAFL